MTDLASIVPDTAVVPVAEDLVHPQTQQTAHQMSHMQATPVDSVTSTRDGTPVPSHGTLLNGKVRSDSDEKEFEKDIENPQKSAEPLSIESGEPPGKSKTGVLGGVAAVLEKPLKGPRGGVHWGAGLLPLETIQSQPSFAVHLHQL